MDIGKQVSLESRHIFNISTLMWRVSCISCPTCVTISIVPLCMDFALVLWGRINEVPTAMVFSLNKLALPVRCLPHSESRSILLLYVKCSTSAASSISFLIPLSQPTLKAKESLSSAAFFFDLQSFAIFLSFCSIHMFVFLFLKQLRSLDCHPDAISSASA